MITSPGNYVNGQWQQACGPTFRSLNPFDNTPLWEGAESSDDDIAAAVDSAHGAFPAWASSLLDDRLACLQRFCQTLKEEKNALAEVISRETGKPLWESKTEVDAMAGKLSISLEAYEERCPETSSVLAQGQSRTRHRPHGVVAVFGPFNFPGHIPNGHILPALLAGNTVLFKPSELTPLVAEKTLEIWHQAGLPPGVLNLVQGGRQAGQALVKHPLVKGLFFTGSSATGHALEEATLHMPGKILALEMGGNNPLVIWDAQDPEAAALVTVQSAFLTAGQRCTCARRLILSDGAEGEQLLEALLALLSTLKADAYHADPEPFMGTVISDTTASWLLREQNDLLEQGARPLLPMQLLKDSPALLGPGLLDVSSLRPLPDRERFGPLLQVLRVPSFEQALEEANRSAYGLSAGLLSDDPSLYSRFFENSRAGIVNWNTPLTGASSKAPFGGLGKSGNHRPSAYYAADYCSYPVASMESAQLRMPPQLPPGISPGISPGEPAP